MDQLWTYKLLHRCLLVNWNSKFLKNGISLASSKDFFLMENYFKTRTLLLPQKFKKGFASRYTKAQILLPRQFDKLSPKCQIHFQGWELGLPCLKDSMCRSHLITLPCLTMITVSLSFQAILDSILQLPLDPRGLYLEGQFLLNRWTLSLTLLQTFSM